MIEPRHRFASAGLLTVILAVSVHCSASEPITPAPPHDASGAGIPEPTDPRSTDPLMTQAVEEARGRVEQRPDDPDAWGGLGHFYLIHLWYDEAAECYRRASRLDPDSFDWHYLRGRSLRETDLVGAAESLTNALRIDPDSAPARVYRGDARMLLGDYEDAIADFDHVARVAPSNPYPDLRRGQIAIALGQFDEALGFFQRALELNPGQSEAHAGLAQLYGILGRDADAERAAEAARRPSRFQLMSDPLWWDVLQSGLKTQHFSSRGNAYLQAGRAELAEQEMRRAVDARPSDPIARLNYGGAMLALKRYPDAIPHLERAIERAASEGNRVFVSPENHEKMRVFLGLAHVNLGDPVRAERYWLEALQFNPSSPATRGLLVSLYRSTGRADDARSIAP